MKVVFHLSEMSKWRNLLANVHNLIKESFETKIKIEVVVNGEAVKGLLDLEILQQIQRLTEKNVTVQCLC